MYYIVILFKYFFLIINIKLLRLDMSKNDVEK